MNPTHIIIHDLNKLRWITNQSFSTNVVGYTPENVAILNQNNINYTLAIRTGGKWVKVEEAEEAAPSPAVLDEPKEQDEMPWPPISRALGGLINSLPSDYF